MGIAIHLTSNDAGMILRMEKEKRWCKCLISNCGEDLIGGQPADYVIHRLLDALADTQTNPAGEIRGHPVSWVMSLASPHVSVYSAAIDQDRWFFFQNAEAIVFQVIVLTPEQNERWRDQLQRAL